MATTHNGSKRQVTVFGHGGARPGAGRKPKGAVAMAPHEARPRVTRNDRVLATAQLRPGLPELRGERTLATLRGALTAGDERPGFRLVDYAVERDRLRLIAQADDAGSITRGMQGLLVRVARALNRAWGRRGPVFADRYRARVLQSPRAARSALVAVARTPRGAAIRAEQRRR